MADAMPKQAPPPTPVEISVLVENGRYVFRTDDPLPVYAYDRDGPGKSNCDAQCAQTWKPVLTPAGPKTVGDWTAILRADQTWQWAYKGHPVYTYAHDVVGENRGDGIDGLWHVVYP